MVIIEEEHLAHVGVMGMRWGRSKDPVHLAKKEVKLNNKIVKLDSRTAALNARIVTNQNRLNGFTVDFMTSHMSKRKIKAAKSYGKRIRMFSKKSARLINRTARYKKIIYKDQMFVKNLNSKMSDITPEHIALGKAVMDGSLK